MDMVHVVVGDQHGVDVVVGESVFGQFLLQASHAYSGIYHDSRPAFTVIHVQEVAVAATAAGQGLEYYLIADHSLCNIWR